eukprot:gene6909-8031_t
MSSIRDRQELRKKEFKKGVDLDQARRKREEASTGIRKSAREEALIKKRREITPSSASPSASNDIEVPEDIRKQFEEYEHKPLDEKLRLLPDLTTALNHPTEQAIVYSALIQFRKLLSIDKNPPIDQVIECGIIARLNQLLACPVAKVQFESAWALTNIASGNCEQTKAVIQSGSVQLFIEQLGSTSQEVQEQCTWALGNISGDNIKSRDDIIASGCVATLVKIAMNPMSRDSLVQNTMWTLSNLCRGKPHADFNQVSQVLPLLVKLLRHSNVEILADACWAASYLSDGDNIKIDAVVKAGIVPRLVELLDHSQSSVYTPALRAIGNVVTGDASQTQAVIDAGVLPRLTHLLSNQRRAIKKEACWAISNITAGTPAQIETALRTPSIISLLVGLLSNGEAEIRKEACWALSNATNGTVDQIKLLVRYHLIRPMCEILKSTDISLLKVSLEAIGNILRIGDSIAKKSGTNPYVTLIEEAEGDQALVELQNHKNDSVSKRSSELLETYFEVACDEDDENCEPNAQSFAFNSSYNSAQFTL